MRAEKQLLLEEIKEIIEGAPTWIMTKYQRLNPNLAAAFRFQLKNAGGGIEVVKKRVFLKAAESVGMRLDPEMLSGHVAIVFANRDPVELTKLLYQFGRENEDLIEILGGIFEGQPCSKQDVDMIAKLPGKNEMRAEFLGLLEAPLSQFLSVTEALLTSVIYCLENKNQ